MAVTVEGDLPADFSANGRHPGDHQRSARVAAWGHIIEYRGCRDPRPFHGSRNTICNMSIEAGARAGVGGA